MTRTTGATTGDRSNPKVPVFWRVGFLFTLAYAAFVTFVISFFFLSGSFETVRGRVAYHGALDWHHVGFATGLAYTIELQRWWVLPVLGAANGLALLAFVLARRGMSPVSLAVSYTVVQLVLGLPFTLADFYLTSREAFTVSPTGRTFYPGDPGATATFLLTIPVWFFIGRWVWVAVLRGPSPSGNPGR